MYLISVYFDDSTNKILQRYIDQIAKATGNNFMTDHRVPPHMTISSIEARGPEVILPEFEKLRGRLAEGVVSVAAVGQLMPYVFYASPVLNQYLQELMTQVYDCVKDIPETTVSRYYRPYSWMPHITLGKTLEKAQMQAAFQVMQEGFAPFEARITEIGLAKVNPHEDLLRFDLGK